MKKLVVVLLMFLMITPCLASTRLMKLSDDHYLITHQKQSGFGGQGKAIRMNYEKAGSLCLLLDYAWFEVLETHSKGRTFGSGAASTFDVRFYKQKPEGKESEFFDCKSTASEEQKIKMQKALEKMARE